MKSRMIFTVIFFFVAQIISAQVVEEWATQYNGTADGFDFAESIAVDGMGNTYVTGYADSMAMADMITVKYNSAGTQLWAARYNGPAGRDDRGVMLVLDDTGNVYVVGSSEGIGTMGDFVTIKYNSSGVAQWTSRYNGAMDETDVPTAIAIDASGNVFVTGSGPISSGEAYDMVTVKYTPGGSEAWVKTYDRPGMGGSESSTAIGVDGSGNIYVTGHSVSPSLPNHIVTIGYTSGGTVLFTAVYIGSGGGKPNSMAVSSSGNIYVTGYTYSGPGSGVDYITLKYNSAGTLVWSKAYSGPSSGWDEANKVVVDATGNVYVTGYSFGPDVNDYATIKYSASGDSVWVKRYNNPEDGDDRAVDMKVDASGNVYVTGWSRDLGNRYDYLTLKYDSSGVKKWDIRYDATHLTIDSKPSAMAIDGTGNIYVTGYSNGTTGNEDMTTIRYKETTTGISSTGNTIPEGFELSQNFPNPFNPSTKISFSIVKSGNASLKVYDMSGKEVASLVNGELNIGTYEYSFDGSGLSSGVYFYTLQSGGFVETKKMNLIK